MFIPKRTFHECLSFHSLLAPLLIFSHVGDRILCAPGSLHETETRLIGGRVQRVYKNLPTSLRVFWLQSTATYRNDTYLVYNDTRLTYAEVLQLSLTAAAIFRSTYGIKKGDRVAICSRNLPEYLVAFWACHLIGAVSVLVNA